MKNLEIAKKIIEENTEALNNAYKLGWSLSMYGREKIGLQHAFAQFNALAPANLRSNLDMHESMILNSSIQSEIAQIIENQYFLRKVIFTRSKKSDFTRVVE